MIELFVFLCCLSFSRVKKKTKLFKNIPAGTYGSAILDGMPKNAISKTYP